MSFLYHDFEKSFDCNDTAPVPVHPERFTDAERYAWIRDHRGDFAIHRALECSDFDPDFDRQIDAAIRASRRALHRSPQAAWWEQPSHPNRRRDDD